MVAHRHNVRIPVIVDAPDRIVREQPLDYTGPSHGTAIKDVYAATRADVELAVSKRFEAGLDWIDEEPGTHVHTFYASESPHAEALIRTWARARGRLVEETPTALYVGKVTLDLVKSFADIGRVTP